MGKYKVLEPKDVQLIREHLEVSPISEENYFSLHYKKDFFMNDIYLRNALFKYNIFAIGFFNEYDLLNSLILIQEADVGSFKNSFEILCITNVKNCINQFIDEIGHIREELLYEHSRIEITVDFEDENIIELLKKYGFIEERLLKKEVDDKDYKIYTYFLEE